MNRLSALRAFIATVEHGSFAAAARATDASNAAVSKNVRELEASLGVRLFHRTTRAMSLTDAGALYHERMSRLLSDMDEVDDAVASLAAEPRGRLRVTAPMSLGLLRISPLMPRFMDKHPHIVLDLHLDDDKDDLIHGGFDLAIRGSAALPDSTLIARRLADLPHVVVASPGYVAAHGEPAEPEALGDHACLIYANSERPDRWALHRADTHPGKRERRVVRVTGPLVVNNSLSIRHAVLADAGIALMPRLYVSEELDSGRLVTLLDGWAPAAQTLRAIYPQGAGMLRRVRVFIDFLAHHLEGFEPMTPRIGPDGANQSSTGD